MVRIALGVEYDGSGFCGWQTQAGVDTIQPTLEAALAFVAAHPIRVHCAGRTDSGVHACGQVVHFDATAVRAARSWVLGANANLPRSISVLWAHIVEPKFHARFSATARIYRYVILNRATRSGLWDGKVSWDCRPLDTDAMATAASALVGEHDFSSFRAAGCQARHPVRTIVRLDVSRHDEMIFIDVEANAFLHHMVRNIAGVLLEIGHGERPLDWSKQVLAARDRKQASITAPASGLYFVGVRYPPRYLLPNPASKLPFESAAMRGEPMPIPDAH